LNLHERSELFRSEMSAVDPSENVELEQLTPRISAAFEEDLLQDEADEDVKEEEMSLLVSNKAEAVPHVTVVNADSRQRTLESTAASSNVILVEQEPRNPNLSLNRKEPCRRSVSLSKLQLVCGPKPGRVSGICFILALMWGLMVLLLHLERKVSSVSSSLEAREQDLKKLEDRESSYRRRYIQRIQKLEHTMEKILKRVNKDINKPSKVTMTATTTSTEPPTTESENEKEDDSFFSKGWSIW